MWQCQTYCPFMSKVATSRVISPGYAITVSLRPVSHASGGRDGPGGTDGFSGSNGARSSTRNCVWWMWIGCASAVKLRISQISLPSPGFSDSGSIQASGLPVPSAFTVPSRPILGPNGTADGSPHAAWRIGTWKVPSALAATLTVAESSSLSETRRTLVFEAGAAAAAGRPEIRSGDTLASDVRDALTRNCMTAPVVCGSDGS